jgi:hypothetical protein
MQKKNPNTPAIQNKLFPLDKRESLTQQRNYWRLVIKNNSISCIYSNKIISEDDPSLDHYLPWSFVAHDHLWNLIPTRNEVNASKSNNIPSSVYFEKFITMQHLGLLVSHERLSEKIWHKYIESYMLALKLPNIDALLDIQSLRNAYKEMINPLICIAQIQGFSHDWIYK